MTDPKSRIKNRCCGAKCGHERLPNPEEPCWGNVIAVDEEWDGEAYFRVHACEGHAFGAYEPEPVTKDD